MATVIMNNSGILAIHVFNVMTVEFCLDTFLSHLIVNE